MLLDAAFLFPEAPERIIGYELRSQTGLDFVQTAFPAAAGMTVLEMDSGPEQIAPLNPDLVMMKSYLKEQLGNQVEQLGIKVVYLDLETPEQINKDIQTLGQIFGNPTRADELTALYDQERTQVTDISSTVAEEEKPSVLVLQYSDKGGEIAFSVPPMNFLQYTLVEMAGGIPVWKDMPTDGWTVVSIEQIAAWNPDAVFIIHYQGKAVEVVEALKSDANWMLLDVVKNNQLFAFPLDFQSWDQPDTRWTLGLAWMAARLHPDLYPDFNLVEETKSFYANFYGLSEEVITNQVLPLLKGDL
jgi:iron complex transport system substrate-binding protein